MPVLLEMETRLGSWSDTGSRATHWIARISRRVPKLFAHWQTGVRLYESRNARTVLRAPRGATPRGGPQWRDSSIGMKQSGSWQSCVRDSRTLAFNCMPVRRASSNFAALRNRIDASVEKASRRRSTSWGSRTCAAGPGRALHDPATNDAGEAASQVAGLERGPAATHAYAHRGTGRLSAGCPKQTLSLLRGTDERSSPKLVSRGRRAQMVADLATRESETPAVAPAPIHPTVVSRGPCLSSLSTTAPMRLSPKVGAGCVSSDRPDLRMGSRAIAIPTPTGPAGAKGQARKYK